MHRATLLLAFSLITTAGCAHTNQLTWKVESSDEMRQLLSAQLPHGTNVDEAKRFMEREGFSCKIERNGTFVEKTWFGAQEPRHENIDFLDCRRTQSYGLLVARFWGVALVLDGDEVEDVLVSRFIDGP